MEQIKHIQDIDVFVEKCKNLYFLYCEKAIEISELGNFNLFEINFCEGFAVFIENNSIFIVEKTIESDYRSGFSDAYFTCLNTTIELYNNNKVIAELVKQKIEFATDSKETESLKEKERNNILLEKRKQDRLVFLKSISTETIDKINIAISILSSQDVLFVFEYNEINFKLSIDIKYKNTFIKFVIFSYDIITNKIIYAQTKGHENDPRNIMINKYVRIFKTILMSDKVV